MILSGDQAGRLVELGNVYFMVNHFSSNGKCENVDTDGCLLYFPLQHTEIPTYITCKKIHTLFHTFFLQISPSFLVVIEFVSVELLCKNDKFLVGLDTIYL